MLRTSLAVVYTNDKLQPFDRFATMEQKSMQHKSSRFCHKSILIFDCDYKISGRFIILWVVSYFHYFQARI